MKSTIIFMSSLFLTAQCMENFKKYTYEGTFYQWAAQAPCFLTYTGPQKIKEPGSKPFKVVKWDRYTINPKENTPSKVHCFSVRYSSGKKTQKRMAFNSALSASGRYAVSATEDDMYIIDIDKGLKISVEGYECINSVLGFCGDDYLIQDSCKDEKNTLNIWSVEGKKRASIPNLRLTGSYISALGYCMLHDQKQFIGWEKIGEKLQRNFLINCADGQVVKQWNSSFFDVVIHEENQIIAGDSDENTIDICSLQEISNNKLPKKLKSIVVPDKKDLIRCWCFNDQGNVLIIGTEKGIIYITDLLQDKMIPFPISDQTTDDQEQITSIGAIWAPSAHTCCFDHGFSSVYCFNPQEVILAAATQKLLLNAPNNNSNNNNNNIDPNNNNNNSATNSN